MKKLTFICLFISALGFAQTETKNNSAFKFEETTIDYGTIKQGSDGYRTFVFTNIGNEPIIINKVTSSCGCTIPEKPLEPIMPGEKGEIKVHYDTNRIGIFQKDIRISSNVDSDKIKVSIKGKVIAE
ncbi:MAG: DUF1573 domain-containing protein [Flavobacteriales bacterium]|jgi:hypothetical protein|nr:DUF1573 domain-containing protein [Flavobacteriales bacterium]